MATPGWGGLHRAHRGSWNSISGDLLRQGQAPRLRSWHPIRLLKWVWGTGIGEVARSFDHQAAAVRSGPSCGAPSAKRWLDAGHHRGIGARFQRSGWLLER